MPQGVNEDAEQQAAEGGAEKAREEQGRGGEIPEQWGAREEEQQTQYPDCENGEANEGPGLHGRERRAGEAHGVSLACAMFVMSKAVLRRAGLAESPDAGAWGWG